MEPSFTHHDAPVGMPIIRHLPRVACSIQAFEICFQGRFIGLIRLRRTTRMANANTAEHIEMHPSLTWLIVGVLLFGGGGAPLIQEQPIIGCISVVIGALYLGALMWTAFSPRSRLRLSPDGFTFGSMRRISTYRWSDVAAFFPLRVAGNDRVCFTFSKEFGGETKLRRINQDFGGFDRFLPNDYGMKADQLADLLESWRVRNVNRAT